MDKMTIGIIVLAFWLLIPIPFILMGETGYNSVQEKDFDNLNSEPGFLNALANMGTYFKIFGRTLIYTIPDAPNLLNYFLLFLKALSLLFVLVMLRGN